MSAEDDGARRSPTAGRAAARLIRRTRPHFQEVRRRLAVAAGAVIVGIAALLFARASDFAQEVFGGIVARWRYAPLLITPAMFMAVAFVTRRFVPAARGSGIPQVILASRVPTAVGSLVSLGTAATKLIFTVLMLGAGASVGREGPTVQVSAAIMVTLHRWLRIPLTAGVLIAGGAAGVAAAFNTPLAGVAFAIEELASAYEQRIALLSMGAVMIAGLVSLGIAGDYVYFGAMHAILPLHAVLLTAPVAGVVGGIGGGLFSRLLLAFGEAQDPIVARIRRHPAILAGVCGLAVAVIGIASGGASWGTGYGATRQLVESHGGALWFGPGKFVATLLTSISGTPGGIFAPSLAVGAGIGNLLTPLFPAQPSGAIVLLGMIAYFVGVVRAPFTAVVIISETTASRGMILPLFATALIAEAASSLVCRERLYHGLARQFAAPRQAPPSPPVADSGDGEARAVGPV